MSRASIRTLPILLSSMLAVSWALADSAGRGPRGFGPPQEAIDACAGLAEGADCSFQSPRGEVVGRCRTLRDASACVPDRPPGQGAGSADGGAAGGPPSRGPAGRHQPPSEAFDACDGLSAGSECTVQTPHGDLTGTCRDHGEGAFCMPAGGPPGRG